MELVTLAMKYGDIDGDELIDRVFIVGSRPFGLSSPQVRDIQLIVEQNKTKKTTRIPLPENLGYEPSLFLGDFTGDGVDDIMIVISSGGSGGTVFAYLYTYNNGGFHKLFDSEQFNQFMKYEVPYLNDYQVNVTNYNLRKSYTFNISDRGEKYLSAIYDSNKKLKKRVNGDVAHLSGIYPVDFERDGIFELVIFQKVNGLYQADGFGYVETVLHWDGKQFVASRQNLALFGSELTEKRITQPPLHFVFSHRLFTEKKRNKQLELAITREFQVKKGIDKVRYYYNMIDLNGDGIPEVFVFLTGSKLCGNEGCMAAIFKTTARGFQLLSKISPVFQPIVVSTEKTNGYHDIITYVSKGGVDPFYARLKFQHNSYPSNPTHQPRVPETATIIGILLLADGLEPQAGILLE
ncbi:MAG: hypothetical protein K0R71_1459 [Bacillales bacterium]|nr:hypothetical protein [Bacillales bacterium]